MSDIESLSGIVQNDINIPEEQIKEWREIALICYTKWNEISSSYGEDFKELVKKTLNNLRQYETLYDVYVHPESGCAWYVESTEVEREKQFAGNDGCIEFYKQGITKQEVVNTLKYLAGELGYTYTDENT